MKVKLNRLTISISLLLLLFTSFANCFGKFPLVRKIYEFNYELEGKAGGSYFGRFVATFVMWIFFFLPVYGIAGFLDLILFNLIEFWTGTPLFMRNGQTIRYENSVLLVPVDANTARMDVAGRESIYFVKSKPWQLFVKRNGEFIPMESQLSETGYGQIRAGREVLASGQFSNDQMVALQSQLERTRALAEMSKGSPAIARVVPTSNGLAW